jgi:hypothetical protein
MYSTSMPSPTFYFVNLAVLVMFILSSTGYAGSIRNGKVAI